jgi:hypothetical protein
VSNSDSSTYHDDPIDLKEDSRKKLFSSIIVFLVLAAGGTFLIQTTLAANISLNSNSPVEFGQGISATTACSGDTQLTITPHAAFTNQAGSGSFKFDSVTVSGIPEDCHGSDFIINAYGNTDNTQLILFNSSSTDLVIHNNAGSFEAGEDSTGVSVSGNAGTFTAVFETPIALTTSIFKLTIQSGAHALSCAAGGRCAFGNRGPGGGIVFYVSADNFSSIGSTCNTSCKYLEVAPATWQTAGVSVGNDISYVWSTNESAFTGQDTTTASTEGPVAARASEKFNWKIGQGFNNTKVMRVSGATSRAQEIVLAYAGSSIAGQWFIPSMNELNELCKYARGQATGDPTVACTTGSGIFKSTANAGTDLGGFVEYNYWSSTENTLNSAFRQTFATSGGRSGYSKGVSAGFVRPIRAF